jgi:hypothetical protein
MEKGRERDKERQGEIERKNILNYFSITPWLTYLDTYFNFR